DMSKIEEGRLELSYTEFDFRTMLQRVMAIFKFRLEEKNQYLTEITDSNVPQYIITDEQRLAQVITNLLSNAVKFTPEKGKISIESRRVDSGKDSDNCIIEIRVTDTGIGISKEQQSKLFQSFVQVDSSISRKYGGTGLGLAISKKIVEMMQGEVRIESEEGSGASFIFTIKTGLPEHSAIKAKSGADSVNNRIIINQEYNGKQILLAEDVKINREIVIAILEDFNLEITEAEDGEEAYQKFAAEPDRYNLIFMDLHMPIVDGYESTKRIRSLEHPNAKNIPIIAMTANVFKEDIERCFAAGMNGHIGKPLNINEMMSVIKEHLGKK
ncbi:MAG: ATP-binding protein, partial [Treponema sp.]|nr:ATP-binding protein [Treponema sp.]